MNLDKNRRQNFSEVLAKLTEMWIHKQTNIQGTLFCDIKETGLITNQLMFKHVCFLSIAGGDVKQALKKRRKICSDFLSSIDQTGGWLLL